MSDRENPLLAEGLREVPVATLDPCFNQKVISRLAQPRWSWRPLWAGARPVLSTALASLLATLAILKSSSAIVVPSTWTTARIAGDHPRAVTRGLDSDDLLDSESGYLHGYVTLGTRRSNRQEIP